SDLSDPILLLAEAEVALREGDDRKAQVLGERAGELLDRGDAAARAYILAARAAHLRNDHAASTRNCALAETVAVGVAPRSEALWLQFVGAIERADPDAPKIVDRLRGVKDERADQALRLYSARCAIFLHMHGDAHAAAEECELGAVLLPRIHDPF